MNKDYKISADGTIFEIMEDGSISKIASIDDNGNISTISGTTNKKEQRNKGIYWFVIILSFALFAICCLLLLRELHNYQDLYHETNGIILSIKEEYPFIITDIEIANHYQDGSIETDYGEPLYSYNTMYLAPRIKYIGLIPDYQELKIKWYNPDGTIRRGDSSPYGFSQSESVYIEFGDNNTYELSGWGNSYKGNWASGIYRIEIWYGNMCLKSKPFTIY